MSENWRLEIDLPELRQAVSVVLDHLEEVDGTAVSIPADYFWSVTEPDIYDVGSTPALTIGQISESWNNLRREREGDSEATIAFAAVWLGDVFKAIGHHASV